MRSSSNVLFLGLWLMGQCWDPGERSYPKPSISVYPNETVDLGGSVNIHCKSDYQTLPEGPQMEFYLQKQTTSDFEMWRREVAEHDEVVFPIVSATPSDDGLYRCIYCFKRHNCEAWSHYSKPVNIRVRGSIVTATTSAPKCHCGQPQNAACMACWDNRTCKRLAGVTPGGCNHSCPNAPRRNDAGPFHHKSPTSEDLTLHEGPSGGGSNTQGSRAIIWVGAAAGILVLLLLLMAFILYRRKRGSTINKRNQPLPMKGTNLPLEPEAEGKAEDDPDEVSYAVLNQYSLKRQEAAKPDSIPESCVYASVANG